MNPLPLLAVICSQVFAQYNITLGWIPSTSSNVNGYNVYYGGKSQTYTNIINVSNTNQTTISNLVVGVVYFFAATTRGTLGMESPFSNEISFIKPSDASVPIYLDFTLPANVDVSSSTTYSIQTNSDISNYFGWIPLANGTSLQPALKGDGNYHICLFIYSDPTQPQMFFRAVSNGGN